MLPLVAIAVAVAATITTTIPSASSSSASTAQADTAQSFLDLQNAARGEVGVAPLAWDDTVAAYARAYAAKRKGDCKLVRSGGPYGENLFWGSAGGNWTAADAVSSWVGEKRDYDCGANACAAGKVCRHYTQVVWGSTTKVGCAEVACDGAGGTFIVCEYDPPGNLTGQRPYPSCGLLNRSGVGVCYGVNGDNLPSASDVVQLYKSNGINLMRIYFPNTNALKALSGSNIGLIMDVPNSDLASLASDPSAAAAWVRGNVQAFPGVNFRYIAVGNVVSGGDTNSILPAMKNVNSALSNAGLGNIKVSTAVQSGVTQGFPPSQGSFSKAYMGPIAQYLQRTGAPLLCNVYPYLSYTANEPNIDLSYALFTSPGTVVQDGGNAYQNLFDALVDTFVSALEDAGAGNVSVVVSESGWPSAGGDAATTGNAQTYHRNLFNHVGQGTPKRPGPMETYIFAMFDEDHKPGAETERHFGLFNPDKSGHFVLFNPDKSDNGNGSIPKAIGNSPGGNSNSSSSSSNQSRNKSNAPILAIALPVVTVLGLVSSVISVCIWRRSRLKRKQSSPSHSEDIEADLKSVLLDPSVIRAATQNFAEGNKLGEGGFGQVYKGLMPGGQEIAVKRLARGSNQGLRELKNELLLVAKLQHRNLVKLIGACLDGEEKLLVYEYIPNKSLDSFIYDDEKRDELAWDTRYRIICGIARGLVYLHDESRVKVIHRDLKPSNILLEMDMNPKISDFGLASVFEGDHSKHITRRVAGTYGYMAPEYAVLGHVSTKSDVFSFGVIILEIVTGRKNNVSSSETMMDQHLLTYVWENWTSGTITEIIDPSLRHSCAENIMVLKCTHIGLLCVQENPGDRPNMSSVILMLVGRSTTLPAPSRPAFLFRLDGTSQPNLSLNKVTITELVPR